MAKIEIARVAEVLKKSKLEPGLLHQIMHAIQMEAKAAAEEEKEEKPPVQKKQFVILISDPEGDLPEKDFIGWVVQIPETASPLTVNERIHKAAYDFNSSRRGRKNPVSSVGEACEAVAAKHFKEAEVVVKTKIPVAVVVTDNQIPTESPGETKVDRRRGAQDF